MNIKNLEVTVGDGSKFNIKMGLGSDALQSTIKDALLNHLISNRYLQESIEHYSEPKKSEVMGLNTNKVKSWSKPDTGVDEFYGTTLPKMLGLPDVYADKKTGRPLPIGSSRRILHTEVVRFFFESNNRWVTKQALVRTLSGIKKLGLNTSTINSYLCETVKSGLMQDISTPSGLKQVRLSPLFINQAKQIGEKK